MAPRVFSQERCKADVYTATVYTHQSTRRTHFSHGWQNFLWQLTLDILTPENKVLAIKPINLGAAPERTSGPTVLVDLCLTVGWGYRHFELSFSNLLPLLPQSHTHIHALQSQVRMGLMSAGSAVSFSFVINNNRPPAILQLVTTHRYMCVPEPVYGLCVCVRACARQL